MKKNFDLDLNRWGPYNKEYLGVCHIADEELGATFNVELFPGFFRRKILVSHSSSDDGLKMWGANPDLTRFSYRYELEWKDRVYCDADFVITDDRRCDITCTFVNNTDLPQSVNMNLCASLQYPLIKKGRLPSYYRIPYEAVIPDGSVYVDAIDYDSIVCAESIAMDGRYLGEFYVDDATGKSTALHGRCFFRNDHSVGYRSPIDSEGILIRYMAQEQTELAVCVGGVEKRVVIPQSNAFSTVYVECSVSAEERIELKPTGKPITLDCLIFGENVTKTIFRRIPVNTEAKRAVEGNKMTLQYSGIANTYTVEWQEPAQMVRRYYYTDIGKALSACIHDHVSSVLRSNDGINVYENVLSEPLFLEPGERRSIHFSITSSEGASPSNIPQVYEVRSNPEGKAYEFSQNMMVYNTFLNVVYPIYTRRGFICHNTPGRNWDSLYSWDSGFIGMGLAVADFDRAYDCLNTYLTPVGDPHSPYIFHGSVVPTQIFLYQYLFNKYPEHRDRLWELYPMVRQFWSFYARMDEREDQMSSKLLKPWSIFYNSGGWDDYPPQEYLHRSSGAGGDGPSTKNTSPIITSAITVLISKILRGISVEMNQCEGDIEEYDRVIAKYSEPILSYAWNEEAGYFSYMVHDGNGIPKEPLKYCDGSDYNQGFDGIYPYIAGITDDHQDRRILENIQDGLITPIGVGVVDTRAGYYYSGGYWNGSVWMPHQWILWRALLDHGEGELAFWIADTALKVWKREVDESYCCFENFMSANGRGSGFHQFSGLSTPVLMFFESYYTPGTVTVGFETTVSEQEWNDDKTSLAARCVCGKEGSVALICLQAGGEYSFSLNGKEIQAIAITDGAYQVELPKGSIDLRVSLI